MNETSDSHYYPNRYPHGDPPPPMGPETTPPSPSFRGAPPPPPPPPKKSRRGLYVFLFVLLGFLLFGFVILAVIGMIGSALSGGLSKPSFPRDANAVALVKIDQIIYDASKPLEIIQHYEKDKKIRAVLLRIDSPGGAVGASQEIYEAILALRRSGKQVVASLGNVAASGGYYIACAADEIVTNPGALTGSIGVILSVPNFEGVSEKIGVRYEVVKSGQFKDTGSITRAMTPEERELLQGVINDTHNQFVEAVLEHRSLHLAEALKDLAQTAPDIAADLGPEPSAEHLLRYLADGRVFTGRQALVYGLADRLGTQADALQRLGELAGIPEPEIYEYKPRRSFRDLFEAQARWTLGQTGLPLNGPRLEYRLLF